jgi:protein kinase C substrate 80K-H
LLVAKYFKDATTFTCISNPTIKIPFARVNDDYCDCPDGSDEPGTSACAHLSSYSPQTPADSTLKTSNGTLALPGFYCKNKGHLPSYVPFTSVNDGVCDYDLCCDGSEEWDHVGGIKCEDKCKEIGKEWKKQDEMRQKSLTNAAKKRKELVKEAAKLRKENEDRMRDLEPQIKAAEAKVTQAEQELTEVQKREKGKMVKSSPGQKGGKAGVLIQLARERTEELRDNLIRVIAERDSTRQRLERLEVIMEKFKEEYNPNFNDEGVKRAVRAWEDYVAEETDDVDTVRDRDLHEITKTDEENGLNWDEYAGEEGSDTDVCKCCNIIFAHIGAHSSQYTHSKIIFHQHYVSGSIKSFEICGYC